MSIRILPHAAIAPAELMGLEHRMAEYYSNPPDSYYAIADQASANYTPQRLPFHCHLVDQVQPGNTVLELGCGTAHLCPPVESKGGRYTGMDYSDALLAANQARHPRARFLSIRADMNETFDVVASLYTIEHVADPPAYLDRMWKLCRPGGLIAVICPEFIDTMTMPPSLLYGRTGRRFRNKVTGLALVDAFEHLMELKWKAPRWHRRAKAAPPGTFWMNLIPRVLHGAEYSIDGDAIHLPRLLDIRWWLENRGATILETSRTMPAISADILQHNCCVFARKESGE